MASDNKVNSRKVRFELERRLKKSQEIFKDTRFLKGLAEETADQIKKRTRVGKSAEKNGSSSKLKGLSESYKQVRAGKLRFWTSKDGTVFAKKGKYKVNLSKSTSPSKSNLTATGQMLDSIFGKYRNRQIEIDIKPSRGNDLHGQKSNVTNKQLIDYNEKMGRRFFDLTNFEINDLKAKIRKRIEKLLSGK